MLVSRIIRISFIDQAYVHKQGINTYILVKMYQIFDLVKYFVVFTLADSVLGVKNGATKR